MSTVDMAEHVQLFTHDSVDYSSRESRPSVLSHQDAIDSERIHPPNMCARTDDNASLKEVSDTESVCGVSLASHDSVSASGPADEPTVPYESPVGHLCSEYEVALMHACTYAFRQLDILECSLCTYVEEFLGNVETNQRPPFFPPPSATLFAQFGR
jgi:hypothetical protein